MGLCLSLWAGSYLRTAGVYFGYLETGRAGVVGVLVQWGHVYLVHAYGEGRLSRPSRVGLESHEAKAILYPMSSSFGWEFVDVGHSWGVRMDAPPGRLMMVGVPFWFVSLVVGLMVWFVWRRTRREGRGPVFPVEGNGVASPQLSGRGVKVEG
jgi:hypothetical protein